MKKTTRILLRDLSAAGLLLGLLFLADVVAFCTWRPGQEAILEAGGVVRAPIEDRLRVASYLFVPVDLLRRYSNAFYRFTENWSDRTHKSDYPGARTPSPFLWRVATFYDGGTIQSHIPYWGALFHGWQYGWHENGRIAVAVQWKQDLRVGTPTEWTANGQKVFECSYSDGIIDGYETEWEVNGKVRTRGLWRQDRKIEGTFGGTVYRTQDGKLVWAVMHYRAGKLVRIEDEDGKPLSDACYTVANVPSSCQAGALMDVKYFIANGIIVKAVDECGSTVPREQWQEEFR